VAPDSEATCLFEVEYRRRLFHWAAGEIKDDFAPPTWAAFWQTALEGRSPGEVAGELGMSVGAVYIARSRVLARLKKRIEQRGHETGELPGEVKCPRSFEGDDSP
jgi:RNA polymerase sigma-70 factor (ECF subfamily)